MSGTAPPAISLLPLGALIQTFPIGPKNTNIVLGFPAQEDYVKHNAPHFGLTIGRYANRIADGKINALGAEGKSVQLDASAGGHCLHGGKEGWGRKVWQGMSSFHRARYNTPQWPTMRFEEEFPERNGYVLIFAIQRTFPRRYSRYSRHRDTIMVCVVRWRVCQVYLS